MITIRYDDIEFKINTEGLSYAPSIGQHYTVKTDLAEYDGIIKNVEHILTINDQSGECRSRMIISVDGGRINRQFSSPFKKE